LDANRDFAKVWTGDQPVAGSMIGSAMIARL
jgi:hypothetical protein